MNAIIDKPDRLQIKVEGSNGNKFTVYKSDAFYQLLCCGEHASINWENRKNWVCKKCGNELPRTVLQRKK